MARKLKVGDTLRGYRVTKVFGPGAMAISYAAESPEGRRIFLKQYKSPAPTVIWYEPFIAYQQELAARVRGGKAGHYAVRLVDAFEERWGGPCYFQAYEFVEHGSDLQQILDEERERHRSTGVSPLTDAATWAQHVTWAKVLMAGIAGLHESKVVHADLKPANVYLIRDPSIGAGYQLKLIDMDFSVLADRHYVELEQRRFFPTALGESVEKVMVRAASEVHGDGRREAPRHRERVRVRARELRDRLVQQARGLG